MGQGKGTIHAFARSARRTDFVSHHFGKDRKIRVPACHLPPATCHLPPATCQLPAPDPAQDARPGCGQRRRRHEAALPPRLPLGSRTSTTDFDGYDRFYKRPIMAAQWTGVSSAFSIEQIAFKTALPLDLSVGPDAAQGAARASGAGVNRASKPSAGSKRLSR